MNELAVLFMLEIFDLQACLVKYCRAANNKTVCSCMFCAEKNSYTNVRTKIQKICTYLCMILNIAIKINFETGCLHLFIVHVLKFLSLNSH